MRLDGCRAVVTGGGGRSSIGYELCKQLLCNYSAACVCVVDNSQERLDECLDQLQRECSSTGEPLELTRVSAHLCDVSDRESVRVMRDEVLGKWGHVNVVFANAGIAHSNSLVDSSWQDIDRVLGVNLHGVINCSKIFLPHLMDQKAAALVTTSSMEGIVAMPGNLLYCASKFAVRGFSEALMMDNKLLCPQVQVSVVHPGFVRTA